MRELKFRAWDKVQGKYIEVVRMQFSLKRTPILITQELSDKQLLTDPASLYVIEQYTGLKDKHGEDIYEGDIVHYTEKIAPNKSSTYEVYYDQLHAMYALSPVDGKIDVGEFYGYIMRQQYEVIGNIHENPELLEGEK